MPTQLLRNLILQFDQWFLEYLGVPFEDWDNNLGEDDMKAAFKAGQAYAEQQQKVALRRFNLD